MGDIKLEYKSYLERYEWKKYFKEVPKILWRIFIAPFQILFNIVWSCTFGFLLIQFIPNMIRIVYRSIICCDSTIFTNTFDILSLNCTEAYLWLLYRIHVLICDITYLFAPKSFVFFKRQILIQIIHIHLCTISVKSDELCETQIADINENAIKRHDRAISRLTSRIIRSILIPNVIKDASGRYRIPLRQH